MLNLNGWILFEGVCLGMVGWFVGLQTKINSVKEFVGVQNCTRRLWVCWTLELCLQCISLLHLRALFVFDEIVGHHKFIHNVQTLFALYKLFWLRILELCWTSELYLLYTGLSDFRTISGIYRLVGLQNYICYIQACWTSELSSSRTSFILI